jgi:hypothetical protein
LDDIFNEHFDSIIDNKIIVHGKVDNKKINDESEYKIINNIPFDGFAICNITTIDTYCKFHLHVLKYLNKENIEKEIEPPKMLYYYIIGKNINIINEKICHINKIKVISGTINRSALLRGRR